MPTRRALIGLAAGIPFTNVTALLDNPDPRIPALGSGEGKVRGVATDASMYVVHTEPGVFSFYSVNDGSLLAESSPDQAIEGIDYTHPFAWSPDCQYLALGLMRVRGHSDIFVANADTGQIINVTARRNASGPDGSQIYTVNRFPQWLDNETLVFVREVRDDTETTSVDLATLNYKSGDLGIWANLGSQGVRGVTGPFVRLPEDRIAVQIALAGTAEPEYRVGVVDSDGVLTLLNTGDLEQPRLQDARDSHCIVTSIDGALSYFVSTDGIADPIPDSDLYPLPSDMAPVSWPAFGTDPAHLLMVVRKRTQAGDPQDTVILHDGENITEIGQLLVKTGGGFGCWPIDGHVVVSGPKEWWLVPLNSNQ